MYGNIKSKDRNSFKAKLENKNPNMEIFYTILVFWPYLYTPMLIDLILVTIELGLIDIQLLSLPKLQN